MVYLNKKRISAWICGMVICSGCATFSSKHVPGDTIADNRLRKGVIRMIGIIEKQNAPGARIV